MPRAKKTLYGELRASTRAMMHGEGWSQTKLADKIGSSQSSITDWLAGGTVLSPPVMERLVRMLRTKGIYTTAVNKKYKQ